MTATKNQYLASIRSTTAYPVYRVTIGVIALLGYLSAGLILVCGLISGLSTSSEREPGMKWVIIFGSLLLAALNFFLARLFKEASLIIVDLGDSTIDSNWRARLTTGQEDQQEKTLGMAIIPPPPAPSAPSRAETVITSPEQTKQFYYSDAQSQTKGPFTFDELLGLEKAGAIKPDTNIIVKGASEWSIWSVVKPAEAKQ